MIGSSGLSSRLIIAHFDLQGTYALLVEAADHGNPVQRNTIKIKLEVTDSAPVGLANNLLNQLDERFPFGLQSTGGDTGTVELNKLIIVCILISAAVVCAIMMCGIAMFVRRTSCLMIARRRRRNAQLSRAANGGGSAWKRREEEAHKVVFNDHLHNSEFRFCPFTIL